MMIDIIQALTADIKPVVPIFFGKPPTSFPKSVADLRKISETADRTAYRLVLDFYTDSGSISDALQIASRVRTVIAYTQQQLPTGYIAIYPDGAGYIVPENDSPKLSHYCDAYEIIQFKNGMEG